MQFRHPPRRRPLSAAPKSCRMPRAGAEVRQREVGIFPADRAPAAGRRGGFHIRPRGPALLRTGPIWNRPLQRFVITQGRGFPGGWASPPVCRGGPWPSRGPCGGAGFPGRCKHRPLQRLRHREGLRFLGRPRPFVPAGRLPVYKKADLPLREARLLQQLETPVILRAFPGAYSSKSRQLRTAV